MRLFATIFEPTEEAALRAISDLDAGCDGIEIRAERFSSLDLKRLRSATPLPLILTWRGRAVAGRDIEEAVAAGIDLVDVEYRQPLDRQALAAHAGRIVLSHHDYEGIEGVETILREMLAFGCAETKLAATPHTLADNEVLLGLLASGGPQRLTVIGMGERGLYSRILAPFRGSSLSFVAAGALAAPAQLTLENALAIYGEQREGLRARCVFAVAGNPAGHSLSPAIHNRMFREEGIAAAYTIASFETFEEIAAAFLDDRLRGLSVTAPFKEEALAFASRMGATIGSNASECGVANTLARIGGEIVADNTDVDGFESILRKVCGRDRKSVAVIGAGATGRAAWTAARHAGMEVALFNRTAGRQGAQPLEDLQRWDGEVVIDTTTADLQIPLRAGMTYIRAAYGIPSAAVERAREVGADVFDGVDLLEAQAVRQHELFVRACGADRGAA